MEVKDCYYLGRVSKPWGIKGQLQLYLDVDSPEEYAGMDSAFVEMKGRLVPCFFRIDQLSGHRAVVTLEDATPEQAQSLAGHDLYLPLDRLPRLEGNKFYFHEVEGFRVVDSVYGDIGVLQQVVEYPAQPVFQIEKNGVEILVPVVDEVIDKVDRALKTLFITAPNGLIELYLGEINK
mgnify:CR=1 FL=1